jgi:hypothetical protein
MLYSKNKSWTFTLVTLLLISMLFGFGCAKPVDPETLLPADESGGYSIVSKFETEGFAQDLIKKGNLLYVSQGQGGLAIIDVSDPAKPFLVSTTTEGIRGYSTKIAMKDTAVFIANGNFGIGIVSVNDPYHPISFGSNGSVKPVRNIHIMGDYLFVATSETGIKIVQVYDAVYINPLGNISTSGYANDVCTYNDSTLLLTASGEMGLQVFDISNFSGGQAAPYPLVGSCDTKDVAESIALSNTAPIAFMACGTAGLQIINFADTNNIFITGSFSTGGYAKELIYDNNKVYITTEGRGLQIIDVSDLSNPKLIGVIKTEYALGIDMDQKYIYLADEKEGIITIAKP